MFDFEYDAKPGERPVPLCLVAYEVKSGVELRIWNPRDLPFRIGPDVLFVAFYAAGDLACFRVLGWPMPERFLDLYVEFRNHTNGLPLIAGRSLIGALTHFGLDNIGAAEKEGKRNLIQRGGPWCREEQTAILEYCVSDVDALKRLFPALLPKINNLGQALQRGRSMGAVGTIEYHGVPINVRQLKRLRENWDPIRSRLRNQFDPHHEIYDETGAFRQKLFGSWLSRNRIPWPVLESGRLATDDDTFRDMAKAFPLVAPIRELKHTLSEMRLNDLAVGSDGRNRCMLSAFGARTGRNTPSNTQFIFGPSVWLRNLIRPPRGYGLAYVDWSQQEIGIAAVLSGDQAMLEAYQSGDFYLALAKRTGAAPSDATRKSHGAVRELFKPCGLGIQYGMEYKSLAVRIGRPEIYARHLLQQCIGRFFARFGLGAIMWSTTRSSTVSSRPFSDGGSGSLPVTIRAPCGISTCRPTGPKCCGWPVVSRLKRGSKLLRQSTMRWFS